MEEILNWELFGYNLPPGCKLELLSNEGDINNTNSTICPYEKDFNLTHCEVSNNGNEFDCDRWTIFQWLFTYKPGLFGLIRGCANVTGIALTIILTTMCMFSMPFVRKSGHFQVCKMFTFVVHTIYI